MIQPYWLWPDNRPDSQICNATAKHSGQRCKNWACTGKTKCRMHGGKSTGAKTSTGKLRSKFANLKAGEYTIEKSKTR